MNLQTIRGSRARWPSLLALSAALLSVAADGPDARLTLAEARERARDASPALEAARESVTAARGQERQAGAFRNPSLVYSHEETSRSGETNRQDIALLEQPLEIAGQRGLRQEAARLRREAAEARLRAAEIDLDFEVAAAYARVVEAERKAARAREAAEAFAQAREISARRRERGEVSGYEDRRMALEAARYAALRADAERERRAGRMALATLLAPSAEAALPLEGELADALEISPLRAELPALREAGLAGHPEIQTAELERRAEETAARLVRRERVLDPSVGLGLKRERMAGEAGRWNGFAAEVSVPVPLWDRRGGAVEAAEAEARRGAAELRQVRRRVVLEIERAWGEVHAASEQLEAIGPQLGPEAAAALLAVRTGYAEGEITLVEWLDAVRAYYEAESTYAGLLADHFIRRAALERAVGGSLF